MNDRNYDVSSRLRGVVRKFKTIIAEVQLLPYNLRRTEANAAIASLAGEVPLDPTSEKYVLCEGLWDHPFHWVRLALFAPLVSNRFRCPLLGVYESVTSKRVRKSLSSLPVSVFECVDGVPKSAHFEKARELLADAHSAWDIINIKLPEDFPGHYVYDALLKAELIGTAMPGSPGLEVKVAEALAYIEAYRNLLTKYRFCSVIVSHPSSLRFATLVYLSLRSGIPVYVLNYSNEHITCRLLKNVNELIEGAFERPALDKLFNVTSPTERRELVAIGCNYLSAVRKSARGEGSTVSVYNDDSQCVSDKGNMLRALGLEPGKPTAVIMTNCWPDFPNTYFPGWYTDYVDWFLKTYQLITKLNNCNWIIKPHPAEFKYGTKTVINSLLPSELPNGVALWPANWAGNLVAHVADVVISANGTAGIEYPALGISAITARETFYTRWNFGHFSPSYSGYCDLLRNAHILPKPTDEQKELAKMYVACALCSAPQITGDYQLPWGSLGYRLWPKVSSFISKFSVELERERVMLRRWLGSDTCSYNFYKSLHHKLWSESDGSD